jgi:UDP-glucose 4-epimerase
MKKLILVTGGTGYIGSHTAVELINSGYEVVIVDNLSNSNEDVLEGIREITGVKPHFEKFDLCDKERLNRFFRENSRLAAIIHFAASKAVGESVEKPLLYYRNNLLSLINLLECMLEFDVHHLVFSSSCTVYGQPDILPVTEDAPVKKAMSPYGNTKQIAEEIIQDTLASQPKLAAISLRYFNPIGAHPSGLIGELPLGIPANLIPFITQTASGILSELKVFGTDYNTQDGSAIRDYINVVDLARAHVVSIDRLLNSKQEQPYEMFNLGTGEGYSVLQLISAFEKVTGIRINIKLVDRRPGDIEKVWANTERANRVLGWKAEIGLEETLQSAWKWEQHLRNLKRGN